MKLSRILILIVMMSVLKMNAAKTYDNSSESQIALSNRSSITKAQTERHSEETVINAISKHKKFIVTYKPPININHSKYRRIKKQPLIMKIQNKRAKSAHITKPTKFILKSHNLRKPRITQRKSTDKAKINQLIKDLFQKTMSSPDINDNTEEFKENTKIVCTGPKIKSVMPEDNTKQDKWFLNNHKLHDILSVRKCFLEFKRLKNGSLFNKTKDKHIKLNRTLQRQVINSGSNNASSTVIEDSSEDKFNFMNELKHKTNAILNKNDELLTTANIIRNTRSKRSVNIIEEEGVATTSSGFKFTGRDSSIHSEFVYRNIHT